MILIEILTENMENIFNFRGKKPTIHQIIYFHIASSNSGKKSGIKANWGHDGTDFLIVCFFFNRTMLMIIIFHFVLSW